MAENGRSGRDVAVTALLVGAVTGQRDLSEEERQAVAEWMIDHAHEPDVRELLTKMVRTQIRETSEWRASVAQAIRDKFKPGEGQNDHPAPDTPAGPPPA